jgi:heme/copper-type cytochrome/quinol oxidase subunit 4
MTQTTLITVNAVLDLAVVLAIFAIVRFTHLLDRDERRAQTIPVAFERPIEDLSKAA